MPACDFMRGRLINSPRRVARNGIKRDVLSYLWTPTSGDGTRTHMLPLNPTKNLAERITC